MHEFDPYMPSPGVRALTRGIISLIRQRPDMFVETGKSLDDAYSHRAIEERMAQELAARDDDDSWDEPDRVTLLERFHYAWSDTFSSPTHLDVVTEERRVELAKRRLVMVWLRLDASRAKVTPRITELQGLVTVETETGGPPPTVLPWISGEGPDVDVSLFVRHDGSLELWDKKWIPVAEEAFRWLHHDEPQLQVLGLLDTFIEESKAEPSSDTNNTAAPESKPAGWEFDALVILAAKAVWPVDELPSTIDAETLRCLDQHGWVEARCIILHSQQNSPGDPSPPASVPGEWFSPLHQPYFAGNWEKFLNRHRGDADHIPGEVRASEVGRADLTRMSRIIRTPMEESQEGVDDSNPTSPPVQQAVENASTHSPDFTSVNWFGTRYTFSKGNQARAVQVLWEAWEHGDHSLSQETIGEKIDSSADRFEMRKTFRRRKPQSSGYEQHPAWGTMIQRDGKGCFRLVRPHSG